MIPGFGWGMIIGLRSGKKTADEQLRGEERREELRAKTGDDVIITELRS